MLTYLVKAVHFEQAQREIVLSDEEAELCANMSNQVSEAEMFKQKSR